MAVETEGGADQGEMGERLRKDPERFAAAAGFPSVDQPRSLGESSPFAIV